MHERQSGGRTAAAIDEGASQGTIREWTANEKSRRGDEVEYGSDGGGWAEAASHAVQLPRTPVSRPYVVPCRRRVFNVSVYIIPLCLEQNRAKFDAGESSRRYRPT